jgi:PhzF family phenazine biosynthesis protein
MSSKRRSTELVQVDAFTAEPFHGNPAAVCLLDDAAEPDPAWMQSVAAEMNLSETAFVAARAGGDFDLRWFTPTREVDLCGHATLASAHALWEAERLGADDPVRFHTRSGVLTATRAGTDIELDFPAIVAGDTDVPAGLADVLGVSPRTVARNSAGYVLVEVASEAEVRAARPDFARLATEVPDGVIVTSRADPEAGVDFISRYFAPAAGIDEDPVTGSAHCVLGPWWSARLGRSELVGFQASARGGIVRVRVLGERVALGGRAVTVLRGELTAPAGP